MHRLCRSWTFGAGQGALYVWQKGFRLSSMRDCIRYAQVVSLLLRTLQKHLLLQPQLLHGLCCAFHVLLLCCCPVLAAAASTLKRVLENCMPLRAVVERSAWAAWRALGQVQCPGVPAHRGRGGALRGIHLQHQLQQCLCAATGALSIGSISKRSVIELLMTMRDESNSITHRQLRVRFSPSRPRSECYTQGQVMPTALADTVRS
jgi:hypothetical protein